MNLKKLLEITFSLIVVPTSPPKKLKIVFSSPVLILLENKVKAKKYATNRISLPHHTTNHIKKTEGHDKITQIVWPKKGHVEKKSMKISKEEKVKKRKITLRGATVGERKKEKFKKLSFGGEKRKEGKRRVGSFILK